MDPEPRSLRPFLLVATSFVILGSVAAYLFWWTARDQEGFALSARTPDPGALHPVDFLPRTPDAERTRLAGLVALTLSGDAGGRPVGAEDELLAAGEAAVPPLLDSLYRLSLGRGFEDAEAREHMRHADRVLRSLRARLSPGREDPAPTPSDDALDSLRRAKAWFQWWEGRGAAGGR